MSRLPRTAVVDAGFWFALFEKRDQYHERALAREGLIESLQLVIPWPCLYETLNTRFVKNQLSMRSFERVLQRPNIRFADDAEYRDTAYRETFDLVLRRPMSLVDRVVRCILDDVNIRKDSLLTFNPPDFIDICHRRQIQLL